MTMADSSTGASPWVVLKFGGTSVSSVANWKNVAGVLRDRLAEGLRPVVVHSALSGITDRLEQLLSLALSGDWQPVMEQIERRHRDLALDLGTVPSRISKSSSNACGRSRPEFPWSVKSASDCTPV